MPADLMAELEKPPARGGPELDAPMKKCSLAEAARERGLVIPFIDLWRGENEGGEERGHEAASRFGSG